MPGPGTFKVDVDGRTKADGGSKRQFLPYFWLDPKVPNLPTGRQEIKTKKSFPPQSSHTPGFLSAHPLLSIVDVRSKLADASKIGSCKKKHTFKCKKARP